MTVKLTFYQHFLKTLEDARKAINFVHSIFTISKINIESNIKNLIIIKCH